MTSTPIVVERDPALMLQESHDEVLMTALIRGSAQVTAGTHTVSLPAGSAVTCWANRPYTLSCGQAETITVRLPRPLLEVSDAELGDVHARAIASHSKELAALLLLLRGNLSAGQYRLRRQDALERAVAALLGAAIVATSDRAVSDHDVQLFTQVCRSVEQHAADRTISIDAIARMHGVSRRKLEMVFAAAGTTPAAYRRRCQLGRARVLLSEDPSGWSVTALSHEVGFGDATAFIRAFRKEFGTTPGAWRRINRQRGGNITL